MKVILENIVFITYMWGQKMDHYSGFREVEHLVVEEEPQFCQDLQPWRMVLNTSTEAKATVVFLQD
jgi:hypothetical protein